MAPSGTANKNTFWVNNSGTWVEFNHYDNFEVKKKQNQMSEFSVKIFDITTAQKAYFKEQAEVLFFAGTVMILKGRIQKIKYVSAFEVEATGFGMESKLLDKQFIASGDNRVEYTNESAQTVAQAINDSILTTASEGLWATDYGTVSLRFEHANRLNALGKLSEAMDYNWWVTQTSSDTYSANYIHLSASQGLAASQKTYNLTSSAVETSQEKDITNLVNYVYALGYGDGINQISTSMYAASTQSSFLNADIAATNTTVTIADGSVFDVTGSARIGKEVLTYSGTTSTTLTGVGRGASSTTAKAHKKNCYIEQHFTTTSAQTGSSVQTYGLMDHTLIDKTIIDEETLEVIASGYLSDRKTPILRIKIQPDEPLGDASLNIGDNVTITDSESDIDDDYRIVGQTYRSNYGYLTSEIETSNRSLEFIEQMNKSQHDTEDMAKYMQGATNIYAVNESENLDQDTPLDMRFYIPSEAVKINAVKLNFKQKGWRSYGTYEINEEELVNPFTVISIGEDGSEALVNLSDSGNPTSATGSSLTDTGGGWGANDWAGFAVKITSGTGVDQLRIIESNSSTVLYLTSSQVWDTIPDTSSNYAIVQPYTSDQTDLDFTSQIDAIGVSKWANIKFESSGGQETYDDYNSVIDSTKWDTSTASSGDIAVAQVEETDTYIETYSESDPPTHGDYGVDVSAETNDLLALDDMSTVEFRAILQQSDGGPVGQGGELWVFGTRVMWSSYDWPNNSNSDDTWVCNKKTDDDWDIYRDGVLETTITPSNNVIKIRSYKTTGSFAAGVTGIRRARLHEIKIGGRARMRIEADAYVQTFLESK